MRIVCVVEWVFDRTPDFEEDKDTLSEIVAVGDADGDVVERELDEIDTLADVDIV